MSHYAVLVVLPEAPTHYVLEKVLAPWHEFGCTGRNDEYVIDVDITDEVRRRYAEDTTYRMRDSEGNLHSCSGDDGELNPKFSRLSEDGLSSRFFTPEGYEEVTVQVRDLMSEAVWVAYYYGYAVAASETDVDIDGPHKFGYVLLDEAGSIRKAVQRTNPNSKWDSWTLGGRYAGRLISGYDPEKDPDNQEQCWLCHGTGMRNDEGSREHRLLNPEYTCNGCQGAGTRSKWPSRWKDVGNTARMGDLDLAAMKLWRVAERRKFVEEIRVKSGLSWEEFETGYSASKAAHAIWMEHPEPRPRGSAYSDWMRNTQPDGDLAARFTSADVWYEIETEPGQTVAQRIEAAPALSAYAVVMNGEWYAKGDMGWFGVSHGEVEDWQVQLQDLLKAMPKDHHIAFVDCHT